MLTILTPSGSYSVSYGDLFLLWMAFVFGGCLIASAGSTTVINRKD